MVKKIEYKIALTNITRGAIALSCSDYENIAKIILQEIQNREYIQHYSEIKICETLHILSFIIVNKREPEIEYISLTPLYSKTVNNINVNILTKLIN